MTSRILFFLLWPLVWLYAPITRRVRVVIKHGDSYVLVINKFGPGKWQLPGGGIKFGESVEAAGVREIGEELGLDVAHVKKLHEEFIVVRQFGLMMRYSYVLLELDGKKELEKNKELQDAQWVGVDEMHNITKEVNVGLELVEKQR